MQHFQVPTKDAVSIRNDANSAAAVHFQINRAKAKWISGKSYGHLAEKVASGARRCRDKISRINKPGEMSQTSYVQIVARRGSIHPDISRQGARARY